MKQTCDATRSLRRMQPRPGYSEHLPRREGTMRDHAFKGFGDPADKPDCHAPPLQSDARVADVVAAALASVAGAGCGSDACHACLGCVEREQMCEPAARPAVPARPVTLRAAAGSRGAAGADRRNW
jgi:hypothetical protein